MSSLQTEDLNQCTNLMELNDDCLHFLLRLFDLYELAKLQGVCRRLDNLLLQYAKKHTTLSLKTLQVDSMKKFFSIIQFLGPSVKSLALDNLRGCFGTYGVDKAKVCEWIYKHLVNLETLSNQSLDLRSYGDSDDEAIEKFFPIVKRLKSLSLGGFYAYICDDKLGNCFRNNQLEHLEVIMNKYITKEFFKHVSNLKSLTISSCHNLTSNNYVQILKKNMELKQLTIKKNFWQFKGMTLENSQILVAFISKNLHKIEDLTLDFPCPNVNLLGNLPHLKKLNLNECDIDESEVDKSLMLKDINKLLEKLSEKNMIVELDISMYDMLVNMNFLCKMTNLKKLTLYGGDYLKDILTLVDPLKKLEELKIEFGSLDKKFLEQLIQILQESDKRPKLQVQAYEFVEDKSLIEKMLEDNKDIIAVRFFYPGVDDAEEDVEEEEDEEGFDMEYFDEEALRQFINNINMH